MVLVIFRVRTRLAF